MYLVSIELLIETLGLILDVEDTGYVTMEHRLTNLLFLLLFFFLFLMSFCSLLFYITGVFYTE